MPTLPAGVWPTDYDLQILTGFTDGDVEMYSETSETDSNGVFEHTGQLTQYQLQTSTASPYTGFTDSDPAFYADYTVDSNGVFEHTGQLTRYQLQSSTAVLYTGFYPAGDLLIINTMTETPSFTGSLTISLLTIQTAIPYGPFISSGIVGEGVSSAGGGGGSTTDASIEIVIS